MEAICGDGGNMIAAECTEGTALLRKDGTWVEGESMLCTGLVSP